MAVHKKRTSGSSRAGQSGIQVIARAADILRALETEPQGLSLGQLAERVDLARSTVQRIVGALAAEHLLIAASPTAGVKLGPALVRLASAANVELDQLLRSALVKLSRAVKETVDLSVLKGNEAVFIDQLGRVAAGNRGVSPDSGRLRPGGAYRGHLRRRYRAARPAR